MRNHGNPLIVSPWCLVGVILLTTLPAANGQSSGQPANKRTATNETDIPKIIEPVTTQHEISASGDYLIGKGAISLPLGFGLGSDPRFPSLPNVSVPDRSSDYFGATVSYSFGQSWFIDISYAHGDSEGTVDLAQLLGFEAVLPGKFSVSDDWYQAYFRYTFPKLRGTKVTAYFRGGLTYVQSKLSLNDTYVQSKVSLNDTGTVVGPGQVYNQDDDVTDILGNLGFGVGYSLFAGRRVRASVRLEGEGFAGAREQQSDEISPFTETPTSPPLAGSVTVNNWLYGGLGRLTARLEYEFGRTGLLKAFADGGIQARYTVVLYDDFTSAQGKLLKSASEGELLWGPYVRVGISYSF